MKLGDRITQRKVRRLYRRIGFAKARLELIRGLCDHNHIEMADYEARPGLILTNSKVCSICGELIDHELLTMSNVSIN